MRIFQKGFNFNQDGPGNRLVYHLQGCNMRCIWCSNPEGMDCSGGYEISVEEMLEEIKSCKMMFFANGGVTFTGGEATMQHKELRNILKLCKSNNINTAVETNATSPALPELLPFIDYLIMDFKHFDTGLLKKYTGMGNEAVKKNFELICNSKRQAHIRIPLINGINTQCPEGFAEYFSKHDTQNVVFEFLKYHEYGKEKWTEEYRVTDGFISEKTLECFIKTFQKYNLKLIRT